jgi:hypothetical protein
LRLTVVRGVLPVVAGLGIGVVVALMAARLVEGILFGSRRATRRCS